MGILLPLVVYILISISGIIGGHEYNLINNALNLGAQFSILLIMIPAIIFILIKKHVHKRCLEIGIACPAIKKNKTWRIILIVTFSFFVLLALLPLHGAPLNILGRSLFSPFIILFTVIPMCFLIANIILLISKYFTAIFKGGKYALYYGALAKTIVPVFALAMIFMTLIIIPYLDWREADLISKDKVMYGQPKSFTHVEHKVVQRLKTAMLKALE